jgi:hypothetical protein
VFSHTRRFVGWLTNFCHQRSTVNVNILRGWSASSFSNAVSTELVDAVDQRLKDRGRKKPTRGFLLDATTVVEKRQKLTVKGDGEISYTKIGRHSSRPVATKILPEPDEDLLNEVIAAHALQLDLTTPHVLHKRVRKLTGGVRINGRPWKTGNHCFFYIPTDRRIHAKKRVGIVKFFVFTKIGRHEHGFVCLDERKVEDRYGSIEVFDVFRPPRNQIIHVDHLTHLVGSLPYFHAGRPDIRCGVPIATTV